MQFSITPSPSHEVSLSRYNPERHQKFRPVFERPGIGYPLYDLHIDPREAERAIVLANRSGKPIIGLIYGWTVKGKDGHLSTVRIRSDIYSVGKQAIVEADAQPLLTSCGIIDESMLDQVQGKDRAVGTGGGGRSGVRDSILDSGMELTFAIDLLVFADGEVAGPDRDNYAADLECCNSAAQFVARQARMAESENRDAVPVLSALAEMPAMLGTDPTAHWIKLFAQHCLGNNVSDKIVRSFENIPALPKLYRREQQRG